MGDGVGGEKTMLIILFKKNAFKVNKTLLSFIYLSYNFNLQDKDSDLHIK